MASTIGGLRQAESRLGKRRDAHGMSADADGLTAHILGAAGEMAVAKVLGRYWGGDVCTFKRADIGSNIQVRTRSRHEWDLIIRDDDDGAAYFVLVTGTPGNLCVRGWIKGEDARRDEWRQGHGGRPPAWFVPQSALKPMPAKVMP